MDGPSLTKSFDHPLFKLYHFSHLNCLFHIVNVSPYKSLAVIIPTYNRIAELEKCLQSLFAQHLEKDKWEVIVVNDGGAEVNELVKSFGNNFKTFYQENQGPAAARNLGVAMTNASFLAFIDDDCIADPGWLNEIYENIKPGIVLGGKVINKEEKSIFSESSQVLIDFLYQYFEDSPLQFFTTNNLAICRQDFLRFGGFRTDFSTSAGEDREFCVRVKYHGMKLLFHPSMLVFHFHHLDLVQFFALHYKYGGAAWTFRRIIRREKWQLKNFPQMEFYRRLFTFPFSLISYSVKVKMLISLCLLLSQVCVVTGFFMERFKVRKMT